MKITKIGNKIKITLSQDEYKGSKLEAFMKKAESENPCWEGYEQIGMKEKDGKQVPNCVKKKKK